MNISDKGIVALKILEGLKTELYIDQAGNETIGYGHKIMRQERARLLYSHYTKLDEETACVILQQDVEQAELAIDKMVLAPSTQNQYDALCSFVYNIGADAFSKSTMLMLLNESDDPERIADEFGRWVFVTVDGRHEESRGLHERRHAEYRMFLHGVYPQDDDRQTTAQADAQTKSSAPAATSDKPRSGKGKRT